MNAMCLNVHNFQKQNEVILPICWTVCFGQRT